MEADIRIWMLTGDKQETAIEIARSCKLLKEGMEEIVLSPPTEDPDADKLKRRLEHNIAKRDIDMDKTVTHLGHPKNFGIIIDGGTL